MAMTSRLFHPHYARHRVVVGRQPAELMSIQPVLRTSTCSVDGSSTSWISGPGIRCRSSPGILLTATSYLRDIADYAGMNAVWDS